MLAVIRKFTIYDRGVEQIGRALRLNVENDSDFVIRRPDGAGRIELICTLQ